MQHDLFDELFEAPRRVIAQEIQGRCEGLVEEKQKERTESNSHRSNEKGNYSEYRDVVHALARNEAHKLAGAGGSASARPNLVRKKIQRSISHVTIAPSKRQNHSSYSVVQSPAKGGFDSESAVR